jgi:hypothetical protein
MRQCGLLLLLVSLTAFGCATSVVKQGHRAAAMAPQAIQKAEIGYQAACRVILHAVRKEYGDNGVGHDVWTDIEEASVFWGNPDTRNAKFVVQIKAQGESRSEISLAAIEPSYLEQVGSIVRGAIAETQMKP